MKITDLRVYWKFLTRNKLYTFVSVFGFSVSLMFVIILGVYVKQQLSIDDFQEKKDRIFLMTYDGKTNFGNTVAPLLHDQFPEVESYVRMHAQSVDVGKKGEERMGAKALFADSTFFNIFSIRLIEGSASQVLQSSRSVVLSQSFARKYYPGREAVGLPLVINNTEYTVTGLMEDMPQNTMLPEADFIVNYRGITTIGFGDKVLTTSDNFGFTTFLLEREGANLKAKMPMMLEMMQDEKNGIWYYVQKFTTDLQLMPLKDAYFKINGSGFGILKNNSLTLLTVYISIAILILVVALLNYINLTVAQASFRGREAAIKKLHGCSRKQLVGQLLGESLIMSACTFGFGALLAFLAEPFFNDVLSTRLHLAEQLSLLVVAISLAFIAGIALISGILPAVFISSFKPIEVVKGTFRRKVKSSYSKVLIIFQYTIAITLLIGSFFIQKQVSYMINYDMGFNREGILEMSYVMRGEEKDGLKSKLLTIPGVELVSFSHGTPLNGGNNMSFDVDGQQFSIQVFNVDSTFFRIYGITIEESTGVPATEDTYWVNRKAYNAFKPDSVSQLVHFGWEGKKQVAGIVRNLNIRSLHQETGLLGIRYRKSTDWVSDVSVKLSPGVDYFKTAKLIEEEYSKYSGGEIIEGRFVDSLIQEGYAKERKTSAIMAAFTALTIIIMIMGVFAMSLYIIRQKQKEISLRKVNGATEGQILAMLNLDSLKRVLIAFVMACPIAYYAVDKWLEAFSYKITLDWWVFVLAGIVVLFLTLLSVSGITWSAARANPIKYLKTD